MKVCLVLQRRFAPVGHALAVALKERGIKEFCAFVNLRANLPFLTAQKEIAYTSLLLDEDTYHAYKNETLDLVYLHKIEQEYGLPMLSSYLEIDRILRHSQLIREYPYDRPLHSYTDLLRILQTKTKAILHFLEKEKPDILFLSVVADLATLFIYHAAKKKGIQVFLMQSSRVGYRQTLTQDYRTLSYIEQLFWKIQKNEVALPHEKKKAEEFLRAFRAQPHSYSHQDNPDRKPVTRTKQFAFLSPTKFIRSFLFSLKIWTDYLKEARRDDPQIIKPWHHIWDRVKRKLRVLRGFNDLYDFLNEQEEYAFFPLQLEPEMGTSLFSRFYSDQLWLIAQTAKALPVGMFLYVKEHPAMYGYRTRSFYQQLKKIPNLKLISPEVPGLSVIARAALIVTLTGTSGWEGMLLGKPVITFGDVFYSTLPLAMKCENINDLPALVAAQLAHPATDDEVLLNFLTAIYKESVNLDLITLWEVEGSGQIEKYREQIGHLADFLLQKITAASPRR